ncbi:hypothetical protein SOVF_122170, partial [Spinacia oleracea]
RKKLQTLCKKHGIPANLKNIEMANRLALLLKDEQPKKRGRSREKNIGEEDMLLSPCVEKNAKRNRKSHQMEGREVMGGGEVVVEGLMEEIDRDEMISEGNGLNRRVTNIDVDVDVDDGFSSEVVGRSSRQVGMCIVDSSVNEQALDDLKVHELDVACVNESEVTEKPATVGTDFFQDKETISGVSAPPGSLSDSRDHQVNEKCHAAVDTMQLEGCQEETDIIHKALEDAVAAIQTPVNNESSMLQNSGNDEVESSPILFFAADKTFYEKSVSEPTNDLAIMAAKDAEDTNDDVNLQPETENSVNDLQVQDGEPAEKSNLENVTSSDGFKSISNEISESELFKEIVSPVSELDSHLIDEETSVDLKRNSCSVPVEPMENPLPKVSHAQDSSPFTAQEQTDRFEFDSFTIQAFKSADSVEKEVVAMSQETGCVEEAEGVSICGIESPKSNILNDLDEALGQAFSQQTSSEGSVKKEFENITQVAGYFEEEKGEGANSGEKESPESNNEMEFGEAVERTLAVQSSLLIDASEEGGCDGGNEIVDVSSMVAINPVFSVEKGNDSDSCSGHLEMAAKMGSLKRNSGKFSWSDAASRLNKEGELMLFTDDQDNKVQQTNDQEHVDDHMDLKHKDACITENDHIALEGSGNIERSCSISVINSAPAHIVHRESGSPGYSVKGEACVFSFFTAID